MRNSALLEVAWADSFENISGGARLSRDSIKSPVISLRLGSALLNAFWNFNNALMHSRLFTKSPMMLLSSMFGRGEDSNIAKAILPPGGDDGCPAIDSTESQFDINMKYVVFSRR